MKDFEKKKISNINQTKRSVRSERRDRKLPQDNLRKTLSAKETEPKSSEKPVLKIPLSDSKPSRDCPEVYEDVVIRYVDDVNRSEEASEDLKPGDKIDAENKDEMGSHSGDMEKEQKQGVEEDSDCDTTKDSVSSQGDSQTTEEEKVEKFPTGPKKLETKDSADSQSRTPKVQPTQGVNKLQNKVAHKTSKTVTNSKNGPSKAFTKTMSENSKVIHFPPRPSSESSEGMEEKHLGDMNEGEILDEMSNDVSGVRSDDEANTTAEKGDHIDQAAVDSKVEEMEARIEKLEEELREVAALEIALYSVVPEHGSSAHKVHTPARRLSRLYIHACKYWSMNKRGTVARNIISGLVLVAKSCSNDVSRLTFWLSNTVVLREIIGQAFGHSSNSNSLSRISEFNWGGRKNEGKSSLNWKASYDSKQTNKDGLMQFIEDWQETRTLTAALEKVESWIFSRLVESIWWQSITPYMQYPIENSSRNKIMGRLSGPALGDQLQGNFSINLWKSAFEDALRRLCPIRSGGHICGCLPVLARMVMEQCVARLDVAMFNAILRESAHEIPTDPVSDPIVDSKVLPIPAGDLSFGSGAQLKNSVGNWSRRLTELFGVDANDSPREDEQYNEDDDKCGGDVETKHFNLLNELSDLLMLPKDMLMDRSTRTEVCPSISLSLIKRILCNFTPDEFCPDPVPGAVLEALNAECFIEQRFSMGLTNNFPYTAPPAVYTPPSPANVAEKVSEIDGKSQLARSSSAIQRKGYTSDEELEDLESPLTFLFDKSPSTTPTVATNGKFKEQKSSSVGNARFDLLREVWSA